MNARQAAIDFVLNHEGGYVNDPMDRGGPTKYGISFRFLRDLAPELADIDGDGDVDADDIRALTEADAATLYRDFFWDGLHLSTLPEAPAIAVMDTAVNMGKGRAVKLLQETINSFGSDIAEDGILGSVTRYFVTEVDPEALWRGYLLGRMHCYHSIVQENKNLSVFLLGWGNRVRDLTEILAMDLAAIYSTFAEASADKQAAVKP